MLGPRARPSVNGSRWRIRDFRRFGKLEKELAQALQVRSGTGSKALRPGLRMHTDRASPYYALDVAQPPRERCAKCGSPSRVSLSDQSLCDRCYDRAISLLTGWPQLPEPPAPEEFTASDGRIHRLQYRLWRSSSGIVAEAEELTPTDEINLDGYHFKLVGTDEANPRVLLQQVQARASREIGRQYLEQRRAGGTWLLAGDEVQGRLVWADADGDPYDVIVDGRRLSWSDLGRALEPYEGWTFRLVIEDSTAKPV